jgi:hypothetical protein
MLLKSTVTPTSLCSSYRSRLIARIPPRSFRAVKDRDPTPEPDAESDADPITRKYHYIDPGMIQYQRASLEQLFHSLVIPLTGYELRQIVGGRRLKLSVENASVLLLVYQTSWEDVTEDSWNSIAELLSDWAAEKIVRETLPPLIASMDIQELTDNPIKLPLRVNHTPPPSPHA